MRPADRRSKILELVQQSARVTVDELAQDLDISRETVRRDLARLSEQGLLRKFHGGATTAPATQSAHESPLDERRATARLEKIRIGKRAAKLFEPGDSLLINCGTTTIFFAEQLAQYGPFTIMTNATPVAAEMWKAPQRGPVYLMGGSYYGDAFETLGAQVVEQIQRIHADHAVLAVGSVSSAGKIMDYSVDEAHVARAMTESARSITVLADSSKLNRNALLQICGPERIDRLITDKPVDAALESVLKLAGVEIIVADEEA
ncbi:DeoR/GlpR transcriptional regulator [Nordella sp. HKS 07]|uniref:DeoR/GlpR family DNA-binding transcription regulator n=1 Tax=Nordella sp. HKS 07 TaxID=2712222 RepID=UPI0013E127A9|nr:DeoR/GlpR family DNA-binding transcription regulator [Nordella sp. HKS 07]QIG48970.1 DeoR/GlpR transcriptional regulator [Nordella sp. HKS 07]